MDAEEKKAYEQGKAEGLAELRQKKIDEAKAKGKADVQKGGFAKEFLTQGVKQLKELGK